jgi:hypothetical protein
MRIKQTARYQTLDVSEKRNLESRRRPIAHAREEEKELQTANPRNLVRSVLLQLVRLVVFLEDAETVGCDVRSTQARQGR